MVCVADAVLHVASPYTGPHLITVSIIYPDVPKGKAAPKEQMQSFQLEDFNIDNGLDGFYEEIKSHIGKRFSGTGFPEEIQDPTWRSVSAGFSDMNAKGKLKSPHSHQF